MECQEHSHEEKEVYTKHTAQISYLPLKLLKCLQKEMCIGQS